ncbi:hypothetical protein NKJ54_34790, partial [Mesorhizobium sp. M0098]
KLTRTHLYEAANVILTRQTGISSLKAWGRSSTDVGFSLRNHAQFRRDAAASLRKLKALLRAKAERTIKALWDAFGAAGDLFTPAECANYFKAAGYEPD